MVGLGYREMTIEDYDRIYQFWSSTDGMGLSEADSRHNIDVFLQKKQGIEFCL